MPRYRTNIPTRAVGIESFRFIGSLIALALLVVLTAIFGSAISRAQEPPAVETSIVTFTGGAGNQNPPEHQFAARKGWLYEITLSPGPDDTYMTASVYTPTGKEARKTTNGLKNIALIAEQTGIYKIVVYSAEPGYSTTVVGIADDHDDDPDYGTIQEPGNPTSGEIFGTYDDDWFVIPTEEGGWET